MKRIAMAAVAVVAIGVGVFFLTRPSADIDLTGGFATRSWGGIPDRPGAKRFAGTGTVIAVLSAHNTRDHAVKVELPEEVRTGLAEQGVRASVLFRQHRGGGVFGDYTSDEDLNRKARATMPADADGELVYAYRVTDCKRQFDLPVGYPLEVDGHEARVEITLSGDERKLVSFESDMNEAWGRLVLARGC